MKNIIDFQRGHEDGWSTALSIYGLRDCTIRNDSSDEQRFPVGRREAYIDLKPGEQAVLRTIGLDRCPNTGEESVPPA